MAAHHLTIAKAAFAAGLLRPDVTKVSRDDLAKFHQMLETAVSKCSPRNIQTCKQWLLENIIPSPARINSFGKYLATLSKFFTGNEQEKDKPQSASKAFLSKRRVHILYIINDILHHSKYHDAGSSHLSDLTSSLRPFLTDLFQSAASEDRPRTLARLRDLLKIWKSEHYLSAAVLRELENAVSSSSIKSPTTPHREETSLSASKSRREIPFVMPSAHGDPAAPFWELPAGNMMPHIMPNSSAPIRPDRMRALQFAPGAPDEGLISAVKDFLKDVDRIYDHSANADDEGIVADIDELGQMSYKDELGELKGDTYYGWSRAFCEKMKRRDDDDYNQHRKIHSRSSSGSVSGSLRKRRRYSDSISSRSRSPIRSRSRSRIENMPTSTSHDARNGGSTRPRSRSRSREPFRSTRPSLNTTQSPSFYPSQIPPSQSPNLPPRPPFVSSAANQGTTPFPLPPLGPSGFPIPPPRPANWTGPWPPLPPPPLVVNSPHGLPSPLPPPPPPAPHHLQHSNFYPSRGRGGLGQQPFGR